MHLDARDRATADNAWITIVTPSCKSSSRTNPPPNEKLPRQTRRCWWGGKIPAERGFKIKSLRLDYNIAFRLQFALETAESFTENRGMLPDAVDRWLLHDEAM